MFYNFTFVEVFVSGKGWLLLGAERGRAHHRVRAGSCQPVCPIPAGTRAAWRQQGGMHTQHARLEQDISLWEEDSWAAIDRVVGCPRRCWQGQSGMSVPSWLWWLVHIQRGKKHEIPIWQHQSTTYGNNIFQHKAFKGLFNSIWILSPLPTAAFTEPHCQLLSFRICSCFIQSPDENNFYRALCGFAGSQSEFFEFSNS